MSGLEREEVGKQGRVPHVSTSLYVNVPGLGQASFLLIYSTCACSMQDASVSVFCSEEQSVWARCRHAFAIKLDFSPPFSSTDFGYTAGLPRFLGGGADVLCVYMYIHASTYILCGTT